MIRLRPDSSNAPELSSANPGALRYPYRPLLVSSRSPENLLWKKTARNLNFTKGAVASMWSQPIVFKLMVQTDPETKKREVVEVEARTTIGDARFVGGGSDINQAMQSLLGAVISIPEGNVRGPRWRHLDERVMLADERVRAQEGYFPMLGRTFIIEAPAKRNEQGHSDELTDEEARPIHAAIFKILDEAESEIRRKLQAVSPTYPTFEATFKLRSR